MKELRISAAMIERLEKVYNEMEAAYDKVASELNFSCTGCTDNCCDSYFLHHTYLEWSYLWLGIAKLPQDLQDKIMEKARAYVVAAEEAIRHQQRPQLMCPLNDQGLCMVYKHRLMVCRTHGVPAQITRPDGKVLNFPGCFRCQEESNKMTNSSSVVERTAMLTELAQLEQEFLDYKRHLFPRVKLTIAEMLVKGRPRLNVCKPDCS